MRRLALLLAMVSPLALGIGCRAVMGRCDCGGESCSHHSGPSNPYPTVGAPVTGGSTTPSTMPKGK